MKLARCISKFSNSKPIPIKVLKTQKNDIYFNLAYEQYLFETANVQSPVLFLWRNSPTIVIGKHQNPWKQCKVQQMKLNDVKLSRRKTGGGAVYQDLGNTCFSFVTPYKPSDTLDYRSVNNSIIIDALSRMNIKAEVSGRNDLVVNDKKFSGSAYRLHLGGKNNESKKSLHHGTIMFSVDLKALSKYLNPNKKKLQSKGIDSVISRVVNLNQLYSHANHQLFCDQIQKSFINYYGKAGVQKQIVNLQNIQTSSIVFKNYQRLKSWDWLYGQCPQFRYSIQKKFQWGLVQITFEIQNGKIQKCKVYSDSLYPEFISNLNDKLIGINFDIEGVQRLSSTLKQQYKQNSVILPMQKQVCEWIKSQI